MWNEFDRLRQILSERRTGMGGVAALAGFQFQFAAALLEFVRTKPVSNGAGFFIEALSNIVGAEGGYLIVTQAKVTLHSGTLQKALKEFWEIDQLAISDVPELAPRLKYRVLASKSILKDVEASLSRWQPEFTVSKSSLDDFRRRVSVWIEADPRHALASHLENSFGVEDPFGIVDKWFGQLLNDPTRSGFDKTCQSIVMEIQGLKAVTRQREGGFHIWETEDRPPSELRLDPNFDRSIIVGQKPTLTHLREGRFAPLSLYTFLHDQAEEWLAQSKHRNDGRLSVFWISGRSGSGKSVALLHLLANLHDQDDQRIIIWLGQHADRLPEAVRQARPFLAQSQNVIFALDDPYAPGQHQEVAASINDALRDLDSIFFAYPNAIRPVLICSGTTDQSGNFERDLADKLVIARASIPDETQQGLRELEAWYHRRTGRSPLWTGQTNSLVEFMFNNLAGTQNWEFFLSYSKDDLKFAQWIEMLLRAAGFSVFAQFNEMPPGSNFVREMQKGLSRSSRFIALLSPSYATSDHCQAEWSAAYSADPGGVTRKLLQFLVKPTDLPPLAKQIVYKHLVGLSARDAAKAVLEAVGHKGPVPSIRSGWPGGGALDRMRAVTGGVYEVAPGTDLRLERMPAVVGKTRANTFTQEQLFADVVSVVADFAEYTRRQTKNHSCSQRLRERAARLLEASAVGLVNCDPLTLNRSLVWVFRVISLDRADELVPPNDEFEHYQKDLYGIYNQLERIFPKLKTYRRMNAHDRFEPPTIDAEEAIRAIYRSLGDPDVSESALSPSLSHDLKQAGESIEDAKNLTGEGKNDERAQIVVEAHADAAARSLAVWSWLSNAEDKFVKSGKKADEVVKAIERYEKLYATLSPLMDRYMGYLVRWFF
jgi:TIR domain